jgi:cellulose biosynthesis protein BcsQ
LGAALAEKGERVLLVDLDPQQNLCTSLRAPTPKPIPKTVRMAEAAAAGQPISQYAPQSPVSFAYEALAAAVGGSVPERREHRHADALSGFADSFVGETVYAQQAAPRQ